MAKITIFGLAGAGKSSVGKILARELGYTFNSSGDIFRKQAQDLGMSVYEFVQLCATDPSYDKKLDGEVEKYGKEHDNFVFESRLAWFFIPDSFKVKLTCDFDTRITRVAERDKISFEEAKQKTVKREETGIKSYIATYGIIDYAPDSAFDLVVDTTDISIPEVVKNIKKALEKIV